MPIYSYKCLSSYEVIPEGRTLPVHRSPCEHEYEVFYSSQSKVKLEEPEEACPRCGGTDKERLVSTGTSFQLKGRGWAKDGY